MDEKDRTIILVGSLMIMIILISYSMIFHNTDLGYFGIGLAFGVNLFGALDYEK